MSCAVPPTPSITCWVVDFAGLALSALLTALAQGLAAASPLPSRPVSAPKMPSVATLTVPAAKLTVLPTVATGSGSTFGWPADR